MRLTKNSYGLDIEGHSGQQHHQLPVPSAFIRVHPCPSVSIRGSYEMLQG